MGVAVTFIAILELVREGLIDIVQQEPFAPIHVRTAASGRRLRVVADNSASEEVAPTPETALPLIIDNIGWDDSDEADDEDADLEGVDRS